MSLRIVHIRTRRGSGRPEGTAEVMALMSNIKAEIHRLNDMIENFLTVGKPLALNKSDVDLVTLIREVVGLARQKAVEQGIAIEVSEATPIPRLQADPVQIKTCLMNVVLNAIQAMPAGGRLRVTPPRCAEARDVGHAPEPKGTV